MLRSAEHSRHTTSTLKPWIRLETQSPLIHLNEASQANQWGCHTEGSGKKNKKNKKIHIGFASKKAEPRHNATSSELWSCIDQSNTCKWTLLVEHFVTRTLYFWLDITTEDKTVEINPVSQQCSASF